MAFLSSGAKLRIFGDPMQLIFSATKASQTAVARDRWAVLKAQADAYHELQTPHHWKGGSEQLGEWILAARKQLESTEGLPAQHYEASR